MSTSFDAMPVCFRLKDRRTGGWTHDDG